MSFDWRCHDLLDRRLRRPATAAGAVPDRLWSARTRANYAFILGGWFTCCSHHEHHPLRDADPRVIERWVIDLQHRPCAANAIAARVSAVFSVLPVVRPRAAARPHPVEAIRGRPVKRVQHREPDPPPADRLAVRRRTTRRRRGPQRCCSGRTVCAGELIACDVTDVGSHSWHPHLALAHHQGRQADRHRTRATDDAGPSRRPAPVAATGRCRATPPAAHDRPQRPVPRRRPRSPRGHHQAASAATPPTPKVRPGH